MKQEDAEALVNVIEGLGYKAEVYDDYSGRGMFGRTTAGVVTDMSKALVEGAVEEMVEEDTLDDAEPFLGLNQDSMGLDIILY